MASSLKINVLALSFLLVSVAASADKNKAYV